MRKQLFLKKKPAQRINEEVCCITNKGKRETGYE